MRKHLFVFFSFFGLLAILSAFLLRSPGKSQEEHFLVDYQEDGCTVIMVGREASLDGSTIISHSADCSSCDWTWHHVPAADHELGEMRKIYRIPQTKTWPPEAGSKWERIKDNFSGLEIPQVPHTYAYHHGVFGYMNEHQLALAESTIGCQPRMRNPTPTPKMDISTLTLIAMERCQTAREAIQLMGSLAEKYGYGFHDTGEMLAVSDPNEVWVFEIMPVGPLWTPGSGKPGAVWCAQRVPDGQVSVCTNESRIGEIDLENTDYFMASPNVVSFAIEHGYYDPEIGQPFNWKKAYSPREVSASSSGGARARLWRFFDLVAPSRQFSPKTPNMEFPFSVTPDKKLSIQDVILITRDKYQGTPFDPAAGLRGAPFANPNYLPRAFMVEGQRYNSPRTIAVNRAEYTAVNQCRAWLPDPIGGIIWLSWGSTDTSCYVPLYAGITEIPRSFNIGDHWIFDRKSARWAFDYVDFHTQVAYSLALEDVKRAQKKWENAALERTSVIDSLAHELYKQDPERAIQFLTDYCLNNANRVVEAWWELGDHLLVKYNHLYLYEKKNTRPQLIKYPDWWLKEVVEYHNLQPQPENKK